VRNKNRFNAFKVCLIGYTNAGKTRIMSRLVSQGFISDDKLFTTLDTVTRRLGRSVVLTDTVGFLGELPHEIIKSFELTIEEAVNADLKLIVIDISDKYVLETVNDLHKIIEELNLDKNERIYVFNKTDVLVNSSLINHFKDAYPESISISAKTGENASLLKDRIMEVFYSKLEHFDLIIEPELSGMIKFINLYGHVKEQKIEKDKIRIEFYLNKQHAGNFRKLYQEHI
jgi:GTP-binding protein HflX